MQRFMALALFVPKFTGQNVVKNVTSVKLFCDIFTIPLSSFVNIIYSCLYIVKRFTVCLCIVKRFRVKVLWDSSYKLI